MTDETTTEVDPKAEPSAPAPAAPASSEAKSSKAPPSADGSKDEAGDTKVEAKVEAEAKPREDWRVKQLQKRVDSLTGRLRESEAALAAKQASGKDTSVDEAAIAKLVDQRAEAKAASLAAQREFDRECKVVVDSGREAFGEAQFNARVAALKQLAGDDDESKALYDRFIADVVETGEGTKLIWELGADLDEASRIMALKPLKRGVELAKLAAKQPPEDITKAPKPITPIGAKSRSHMPIDPADATRADQLSTREWMERRNAQAEESWKRRAGR